MASASVSTGHCRHGCSRGHAGATRCAGLAPDDVYRDWPRLRVSWQLHTKTRLDEKSVLLSGGATWVARVCHMGLRLYRGVVKLSTPAVCPYNTGGYRSRCGCATLPALIQRGPLSCPVAAPPDATQLPPAVSCQSPHHAPVLGLAAAGFGQPTCGTLLPCCRLHTRCAEPSHPVWLNKSAGARLLKFLRLGVYWTNR